jgi:hypothetical protein
MAIVATADEGIMKMACSAIVAKGPEELTKFYASLFGWKVDTNNALGYQKIGTSERTINAETAETADNPHILLLRTLRSNLLTSYLDPLLVRYAFDS